MSDTLQKEHAASVRTRVVAVALLWLAACTAIGVGAGRNGTSVELARDDTGFAGTAACAECHGAIVRAFEQAPHGRTLSPTSQAPLGNRLAGRVVDDPGRNAQLEFVQRDGRFFVKSANYSAGTPVELAWCFGSGEHAQTLVGVLADAAGRQSLLQCRLSWYRETGELGLTPGERPDSAAHGIGWLGQISDEGQLRRCFGCHATTWRERDGQVDFASLVPGVQCERCHGPRRAHIAAAQRGAELSRAAPDIRRKPALESVRWCGGCHRQDELVTAAELDPNNTQLARFAPIGLVQSKCFQDARGRELTCMTCHDPHQPAGDDARGYSATCRTCHTAGSGDVACRVEPGAANCIACHMPKVQVGLTSFTDHWIRVRQAGSR